MRVRIAGGVVLGVSLLAFSLTAAGPSAWANRVAVPKPVIRSVTFSGSARHPTITIRGAHFGKQPRHDPGCHPAGEDKCGHYTGYDFGTALYLVDKAGGHGFSAGRYRPGIHELDAVSFRIIKYTRSKIVLHFGNWYLRVGLPQFHLRLAAGDHVTMTVRGRSRSVTVKY
jgi:hypothetical protein